MVDTAKEQHVAQRYDRARTLGLEILKLLLQTNIVIAGVPILFYDRVIKAFPGIKIYWVSAAWTLLLIALILGFTAFLFIFEGDYHAAHMVADRAAGDANIALQNESRSNRFFDIGHVLGILTGTSFALGIACVIVAIWIS